MEIGDQKYVVGEKVMISYHLYSDIFYLYSGEHGYNWFYGVVTEQNIVTIDHVAIKRKCKITKAFQIKKVVS